MPKTIIASYYTNKKNKIFKGIKYHYSGELSFIESNLKKEQYPYNGTQTIQHYLQGLR